MPKGILKTNPAVRSPQEKGNRLKWDEESLLLTEAQKDSKMKIDEPKTPFVHSNPDDFLEDDLEEMTLNTGSHSPRRSLDKVVHLSSGSEWDEDDEPVTEEDKQRHRKFVQMRAKHYNMKEAFVRPSDIDEDLDNDSMDDDDDDDDSDDAANMNHRNKFQGVVNNSLSGVVRDHHTLSRQPIPPSSSAPNSSGAPPVRNGAP
ncbi:hypothetical protein IWQ62_003050 [Dispira parvispora]|uniref:Protein phosphatase inhibitor 2 n=1 Tax=Dispira parvispora TaxID=1520584 RepID=A0A9W8E222_9FUNG|nr:hypothetical protein IWQ62_003050 [Dispira parvispora]